MAITVSEREGILIFRLSDRIIISSAQEVLETVTEMLAGHPAPAKIVFDFKAVTGLDSSGLGALMEIHSKIRPGGGDIAVINVNKQVKNLIAMARLITVFEHFESEDAAITALLQPSE